MNSAQRTKNILVIDTSDNKKIIVGLRLDDEEDIVEREVGRERAQAVLPLMDALLKKHKLRPQDLSGIAVTTGPGSFTGLRVGISIANTLAHELRIPINGGEPGESVEAVYS